MNLQVERLDTHEARLTIDVEPAVLEQTRREVAKNLAKQIRVPGFRPGMAPMQVVINAIGGESAFAEEVNDALAKKIYPQAVDESKVNPYGPGLIEKVNLDPPQIVARVPLEPEVDLKDYRSIRLPFPAIDVTDDEIEVQLQSIREDNAIIEMVDRPAQLGDMVEASITGEFEGEEVLRQRSGKIVLDPERLNVPGLADALVGATAGQHLHADVRFPDDFDREDLRGKDVHCHIDVTRVNSRTLPDINDELAQTVGAFQSLAQLREDIQRRLHEMKTQQATQEYSNSALDTFANLASVAYPPAFIEDRLNDMMAEYKEDVREAGIPFDEWLKVRNQTEEAMRDEFRPQAEMRSRRGLVMRELARAENLSVSDAEVEHEFEHERELARQNRAALKKDRDTLSTIRNNLLSNKVIDRMIGIAKGEAADNA